MKNAATFIFLFFCSISYAEKISNETSIKTIREAKHSLTLKGNNCKDLNKEFNDIKKWSAKKFKSKNSESKPDCKCDEETNICKINIDKIAPEIVKLYQDRTPKFNGPNCWNSTLVTTGILPHPRYSTPEEMEFWMKSPLCREKKLDEEMEPGDAIAIRNFEGEYHGFIYVSDKISWSKNGYNKRAKYDLQGTENVFDVYGVPEKCQRIAVQAEIPKECAKYANVYQCRSWNEYWSEVKESANVDEDIDTRLDNIDCLTSKYVFGDISPSPEAVKLIEATLDAISFEVVDLKNKLSKETPEAERVYVQRAVHRISSLKEQFYLTSGYF
ncbi:hypothetical protein [Bacteriovorax sp. Seq25_V]|uniref:hypothetical protein n=1 Tax=Bacteriovorax sp. Seq25_V TaxID=1201288 RepID=UPI00038A0728|nr:hypothetical protein [Bacteriovorax sp. Seq25_V]EQC46214.1 hypothetical protein M900_1640 [Bacteriovorax sp. Seq25_V]